MANIKIGSETVNNISTVNFKNADDTTQYVSYSEGGGSSSIYRHVVCVRNGYDGIYIYLTIFNSSATPITLDKLKGVGYIPVVPFIWANNGQAASTNQLVTGINFGETTYTFWAYSMPLASGNNYYINVPSAIDTSSVDNTRFRYDGSYLVLLSDYVTEM